MNLLIVTLQMFCIPGMGQVSAFHVLESVSAWSWSGFDDVGALPFGCQFALGWILCGERHVSLDKIPDGEFPRSDSAVVVCSHFLLVRSQSDSSGFSELFD